MARKNFYIAMIALFACGGTAMAQDYFDDIYYNPKKDTTATTTVKKEKKSNYISNFEDIDVDAYNRRGEQYYVSQIDTIGTSVENGEDFVYTQQIQKYYNPTIVVENANSLGDILANARGNVEIVINDNGYPVFAPWYGYNWPYYSSVWSPWSWGLNIGPWGWNVGWYDPWYAWNWGPSWGWGPGWGPSWGWGPGWGPGPSWGPAPLPVATWSPRGNRTVGPRPGWSAPTPSGGGNIAAHRPAGNYGGGNMGNSRPGGMQTTTRPSGVVNNGGRWEYNTTGQTGHRTSGTGVLPSNRNNASNQSGVRTNTPNRTNNSVTNSSRNNTTNRSTISNSRSTTRSTGGFSTGGGRSTGGRSTGGGGRHR